MVFYIPLFAALMMWSVGLFPSEAFFSITSSHVSFQSANRRLSSPNMASFGDANYKGFSKWCDAFGQDQKEKYPEYFKLPEGVYEILIEGPLGIVFEEVEVDGNKGVFVAEVLEGGNAAKSGVNVGDKLLATTAVIVRGAKFERPLLQADIMDYDSIISAVLSNFEAKFRFDHAILQFLKEDSVYPESYMRGEMRKNASPLAPLP